VEAACVTLALVRTSVLLTDPYDLSRSLMRYSGAWSHQLSDNLSGGFVFNVRRQFNSAIIALRSRGQNDELRIGKS
jgi:hypothetical protein